MLLSTERKINSYYLYVCQMSAAMCVLDWDTRVLCYICRHLMSRRSSTTPHENCWKHLCRHMLSQCWQDWHVSHLAMCWQLLTSMSLMTSLNDRIVSVCRFLHGCFYISSCWRLWLVSVTKAQFPLPELTDGWPVSITPQHGPCWRVMETGHPSTRVVETGLKRRIHVLLSYL